MPSLMVLKGMRCRCSVRSKLVVPCNQLLCDPHIIIRGSVLTFFNSGVFRAQIRSRLMTNKWWRLSDLQQGVNPAPALITHSVLQAAPCSSCSLHSLKLCHAHFCNFPSCWQTWRAGICPGGSTQIAVQDLLECPKRSIYPYPKYKSGVFYSFSTILLQCRPLKEGILSNVEESKVAFFNHFVPLTTDGYC